MKNFYFVVREEENGKMSAYVETATVGDNLISKFSSGGRIKTVIIAETKRDAEDIARIWNEDYKKSGKYMWS